MTKENLTDEERATEMTHLLITTERTYDGQIAVERQLIGFEDYVQDCPEEIYEEAGGKQTTPSSLCDAISKVEMHNNGQVKVSAKIYDGIPF